MHDNQTAMLLEKNYPFSVWKGSKHINIRYFFVTEKVQKREVKVLYCPTSDMIADYNTKPLQGVLFVKFRDLIMGINQKEFDVYKQHYKDVLTQYNLFDEHESDLFNI